LFDSLNVVFREKEERGFIRRTALTLAFTVCAIIFILIAMSLVVAGSVAFSWYVANFGSYNTTHGSLGAVIGFMTWIWLSAFVVLLGAQLDWEMETRARWDEKVPVDNHPARLALIMGQEGQGA
jgi:membrane protein